jgi:hypothetical protein
MTAKDQRKAMISHTSSVVESAAAAAVIEQLTITSNNDNGSGSIFTSEQ